MKWKYIYICSLYADERMEITVSSDTTSRVARRMASHRKGLVSVSVHSPEDERDRRCHFSPRESSLSQVRENLPRSRSTRYILLSSFFYAKERVKKEREREERLASRRGRYASVSRTADGHVATRERRVFFDCRDEYAPLILARS